MHWAVPYIGMPYVEGGRGPVEVDCWGLLRLIYLREFNIELPLLPGIAAANLLKCHSEYQKAVDEDWLLWDKPFNGAAVAMSQGRIIHHVGIWANADGGKVIHAHCGLENSVADTLERIRLRGYNTVRFYKHRLWPT